MISPVDESAEIPKDAECQEASPFSIDEYVACGRPAVAMVRNDRDGRSYLMCAQCEEHNILHRGGRLVKVVED